MLKQIYIISKETFLLLRRDKIYLPAIIIAVLFFGLANLASDWGVEEFTKILFDIGAAAYHFTGSLIAIFWGVKLIADARKEGSIEVQLSAPVSRTTWLIGKYLGLCLSLLLMSVILLIIWQLFMLANMFFSWMTTTQILIFIFLTFNWLILGAVSIFFSTISSSAIALFSSFCLWIAGLISSSVLTALSPNSSQISKFIVVNFAKLWDLNRFNLSNQAGSLTIPPTSDLIWLAVYGISIILVLMTFACLAFRKQDLVG